MRMTEVRMANMLKRFTVRTLKSTVRRKYLEVIAPDHYDDFTIVAEDAGKLPSIPYYSV